MFTKINKKLKKQVYSDINITPTKNIWPSTKKIEIGHHIITVGYIFKGIKLLNTFLFTKG